MTEEQIIQEVCEIMGVNYSHYDNHNMGLNYFPHMKLTSRPKIVVYSTKYGPYEFSILEDMTIITPLSSMFDTLINLSKKIELDDEQKESMKAILNNYDRKIGAENFLKDNNCSIIINDVNKKINFV